MFLRKALCCAVAGLGLVIASPNRVQAQVKVLSAAPPNVEYQYQLYYPRFYWAWAGPGLSLGGSLPSKGREGISSFYGRPIPAPLGAGVYVNPFAYGTLLPGPGLNYGLASTSQSPTITPQGDGQPISQIAGTNPIAPGAITTSTTPTAPVLSTTATKVAPPAPSAVAQPITPPISTSTPLAIVKSTEMEAFGDENFKQQQWVQAYVNYHNAVMIAGDRASAQLRLGFTCLALKRYPESAQAFKQAFAIDPSIGKTGDTLDSIFGPLNPAINTEITEGVVSWAKDDLRNQDRLFLLGVVLHYKNDARSAQILEAAMRIPGPKEHLVAVLNSPLPETDSNPPIPEAFVAVPSDTTKLPPLHEQPLALQRSMR